MSLRHTDIQVVSNIGFTIINALYNLIDTLEKGIDCTCDIPSASLVIYSKPRSDAETIEALKL